jgi:hypothetical protein
MSNYLQGASDYSAYLTGYLGRCDMWRAKIESGHGTGRKPWLRYQLEEEIMPARINMDLLGPAASGLTSHRCRLMTRAGTNLVGPSTGLFNRSRKVNRGG